MNDRERFKAICHGEHVDYVPILGFPGAWGFAGGVLAPTHARLIDEGMPDWVDGCIDMDRGKSSEKWNRYWGTTEPVEIDFRTVPKATGIKSEKHVEGEREVVEYESGALTRQVIGNAVEYSMPEYVRFHVRDRRSWEFYRERMTPSGTLSTATIEENCRRFDDRAKPLIITCGSTWGFLRELMGPEAACTILYDDPELAHEIIEWNSWKVETYVFPVVRRLRPEILAVHEDMCYNHGLLISPAHFREFCAPYYRKVATLARDSGADLLAVDTDGNIMEIVSLLAECGVNGIYPCEVKGGNDLFQLRRKYPSFIFAGWIEKEIANKGNDGIIEPEMAKVREFLKQGRYFPNADHLIQPLVTFEGLCLCLTALHDILGNPEGEFPRMRLS